MCTYCNTAEISSYHAQHLLKKIHTLHVCEICMFFCEYECMYVCIILYLYIMLNHQAMCILSWCIHVLNSSCLDDQADEGIPDESMESMDVREASKVDDSVCTFDAHTGIV